MIKGLMMASGLLTMYILYGKNFDGGTNNSKVALYSFLNICWALCFFALLSGDEMVVLGALVLIIAYPAIIIALGIRNRRKAKANDTKTEKND